eukprot:scaffold76962_cov31-Tisochrysis_lutea.AAC.1
MNLRRWRLRAQAHMAYVAARAGVASSAACGCRTRRGGGAWRGGPNLRRASACSASDPPTNATRWSTLVAVCPVAAMRVHSSSCDQLVARRGGAQQPAIKGRVVASSAPRLPVDVEERLAEQLDAQLSPEEERSRERVTEGGAGLREAEDVARAAQSESN